MNELQKFLERIFGKDCLTLAEGTEMNEETAFAAIQELVNSRNTLQTTVDNLTTEKTSLTEQVTNLNAEVANLKEMAQVGKTTLHLSVKMLLQPIKNLWVTKLMKLSLQC